MQYKSIQIIILVLLSAFVFPLAAQDCTNTSCVWPGDANNNGIANNIDFMYFVYAQESGGLVRENANVSWTGQTAEDWTQTFPSGINYKHSDTDGDGYISGADAYAWTDNNYNSTNEFFEELWGTNIPGQDLYISYSNMNPNVGDTISLIINLGSEDNPINDITGIAFSITIDTAFIKEELIGNIDFSNSWFGEEWVDFAGMDKYLLLENPTERDLALARLGGIPVSGWGEIARFDIIIEDVLIGLLGEEVADRNATLHPMILELDRVFALNDLAEEMLITIQTDTLLVDDVINATTTPIATPFELVIYPNPSSEWLTIKTNNSTKIEAIRLTNHLGQHLFSQKTNSMITTIFVEDLPAGIYLLQVKADGLFFTKKVIIH